MPRKKKEETSEEKKDVKTSKINPNGWQAVVNKAKFTKAK